MQDEEYIWCKGFANDEPWIVELGGRMTYAPPGEILKLTTGTLRGADSLSYRPLLHHVELGANSQMMFEVLFVVTEGTNGEE